MLLCGVGVSERDRRGWKLGSPPVLVHPAAPGSMLGDSTITSSGSGGAPGSPGFGRLEEEVVEEGTVMLAQVPGDTSQLLCNDGRLREAPMSEVAQLRSPSGWKSMVELFENDVGRSLVLLGLLTLQSDDELQAAALRDSIFSFLAIWTSSVILAMMKFCVRISLMESVKASKPRGFSSSMSNNLAVLLLCVVLQLISSASSRVRILHARR